MGFQELALLFLLFLPLCSAQSTYYVTPTPDTPCPGQPCYSLSEYVTGQVVQFNSAEHTFVFLPGDHIIEYSIPITLQVPNLNLLGDSASFPEVTSMIICNQPMSFAFLEVIRFNVSGIAFKSCGSLYDPPIKLLSVFQAEISNCMFQGGQNGALAVVDSTLTLLDNTFLNNSATIGGGIYIDRSIVHLTRNTFVDNYASENGSGVYIESDQPSTVSFTENSFIGNNGDGAVVFVGYNSEVTFIENEFLNNSGSNITYGSQVSNTSTFYVTPTPDTPCPGKLCYDFSVVNYFLTSDAVLVFLPGNYSLERPIIFKDLDSLTLAGDSSSLPQVTSSILCSQQANMFFTNIGELFIADIAILSCGTSSTASVQLVLVSQASISNCIFRGGQNGALRVDNSNVHLANNTFEYNSAKLGGGVYIERSLVTFTGNSFISNHGSENGAAVFVSPGGHSTVNFSLNSFINNTGGGAVVYVDPFTSDAHFGENVFVNNSASECVSCVPNATVYYVIPTAKSPCPEKNCFTLDEIIAQANQYITLNTSLVFLPGNHTVESRLSVRNIFSLTMIGSPSNSTKTNLICSKPASFAFYNVREVYISSLAFLSCGNDVIGATISLNLVLSSQIINCSFWNNTNKNNFIGGALAIESSHINLSGNSFTNNIAAGTHGGGVHMKYSTANINGNNFTDNSASGWGGGACLENSTVSLNSNLFKNNTASYGGGIEIYFNSIVNATDNTFTKNIAGIAGGGIDVYFGVVANFVDNIFDYNKAQSRGGGVTIEFNNRVSFTLDTFMFNTASEVGGGVWVATSIVNITESNLTGNVAGNRGGGSYLSSGTVIIFGENEFINNSASFNGAGIYSALRSYSTECTNNIFRNNWGGGWVVFIEDSDRTSALLSQSTFENNTGNVVYGSSENSSSTYHITPSPDTLCPNEPCLTISEFIDQAGQYIALNTTLIFLPGTHTVRSGLLVERIASLTLVGNSSAGSFPMIMCDRPASFGFKYIDELLVRSLAFDSCGDGTYAAFNMKSVSILQILDCDFKNSIGGGGAVVVANCDTLHITETVFEGNSAIVGGGLYVSGSVIIFINNTFVSNKAEIGGAGIKLLDCNGTFEEMTVFKHNSVSVTGKEIINNDREFREGFLESAGAAVILGGAMLTSNCNVTFLGNVSIENNTAEYGGGITALKSNLKFSSTVDMQYNTATYGGGVCAFRSTIAFGELTDIANNRAEDSGGAVYAIDSNKLNFTGTSNFRHNTALNGGGLYLDHSSLCYFSATALLYFVQNFARKSGGAIYVADRFTTLSVYCAENSVSEDLKSYCFFQVQTKYALSFRSAIQSRIYFDNNYAIGEGGDLYGGTIDDCKLQKINICSDFCDITSSGEVFNTMTNGELDIASVPLQVCHCENQVSICSQPPPIEFYPGKKFSISVTVLGQRNGTVPTVIQTQLSDGDIKIQELQDTQKTTILQHCSELSFTLFPSAESQQGSLILSSYSPCPHDQNSLIFPVQMLPCPHGFQLSNTTIGMACDCDERLKKRFTESCNITTGTIFRPSGSTFWVGHYNDSRGLIIHPHCPFDYCTEEEIDIDVDSSDTQCSYNRSGVLCGECGYNLSLALGNSRCLECSNDYLALLLVFATAGIILVLFLFTLKLTVSVGTINGLIFYANVVQVNSAIFIPPGPTNPLTLFIAWLNLDLGIETCFFDGMNAYSKTWLQFVFPIYVWTLVVIIIVVSHYSSGKIARLFGRNPIAVLATLFLLSYAKLLRTIIAAFAVTYVEYQDNKSDAVWLYDGNIKYLSGKHVPLFIVAFVFLLLLFLPYTLLLLLSQWLQAMPKVFFFINNHRMKAFLDAYHAPYNGKHRYWTGLLLCIRCILFLAIVFSALGDVSVNLLSILSAVLGLFSLKSVVLGGVYKNWYVGALETSFLLNLCILAAATYHVTYSGGSQAAVTYTLLSIAFITFVGILIYHISLQIRGTALGEKISTETRRLSATRQHSRKSGMSELVDDIDSDTTPMNLNSNTPTYSRFELSIRDSVVEIM